MFRSHKTPSAGIMRLFKTKPDSADQALGQDDEDQRSSFVPGYLRLEQRALLSATFLTLGTTELVIDDFDAGQDLSIAQQNAIVNGSSQDSYVFTVDSGSFTGSTLNPLIELESVNGGIDNQLEIATSFFQGGAANAQLTLDGLTSTGGSVEFTQTSSSLTFNSLELSNFANDNRDFDLVATGDVTLDNVTVFDSNPADGITAPAELDVSVNGNLSLAGLTGNLSTDPDANVDLSATGNISSASGSELTSEQTINLSSTNGSITLEDVSAGDDLQVVAANNIVQQASSDIVVGSTANFSSTSGNILLAAAPDQTIDVQGQANFVANNIEIGLDGQTAGSVSATNVQLGSVSLDASQAVLVEDDSTLFSGASNVSDLFVSSAQDINNAAGASLVSTNAQLNSADDIVLGNQAGDSIAFDQISLIADNAHLEVDDDIILNGIAPAAANSTPISIGTNIDQTLYVFADGSVEQTQGDLSAQQIGIEATQYVHLTSIAADNEAIAITAGSSTVLTDPSLSATLNALATVENGEVDATLAQAIAVAHRGDLNVANVTSVTGTDSLSGFNSTDGSISVFADQTLSLQQDVTAFSPTADPQVTLYSATGDGDNPNIFFDGGEASVTGPTNFGVVNANQTFANFFDTDGFLFDDTTQILTLNTDGTVSQDIVIEYGNIGEAGFRVGIVFDSLNEPLNPVEDLNLFLPSTSVASEAFEDSLFQNNTVTQVLIGGNEGGRETFSKVDDFSAQAVIAHFDDPNVFTDVTVRNDQHINLFSGSLDSVTNALNENVQQLLQAEFDSPRGDALDAPAINTIASIEVRTTFDLPFDSPAPVGQSLGIFGREVAPFENGELRWVQVEVPIDDLEIVGDDVQLKEPTKLYPAIDDATEQVFENVGENETEEIANQIERSPEAEPGYWYRIFKAYDNRGDELFFYYYKTGEVDDIPAESAQGEDPSPIDQGLENNDDESANPNELDQESGGQASVNDFSNHNIVDPENRTSSQSIAASPILMGLLRRHIKRNESTACPDLPAETADSSHDSTAIPHSYDRLSRLKRKLKQCL